MLLAVGAAIDRNSNGVFFRQFGLAIGLTGGSLVCIGSFELAPRSEFTGIALGASLATIAFYRAYRSSSFRFLSCLASLLLITGWSLDYFRWRARRTDAQRACPGSAGNAGSRTRLLAIRTRLAGTCRVRDGDRLAGDAVADSAAGRSVSMAVGSYPAIAQLRSSWYHAAAAVTRRRGELFGVPAAGVALLRALSAPGLLASIGLTVLGHLERNVVLKGLGLLFLPVYLAAYYQHGNNAADQIAGSREAGAILWGTRARLQHRIAIWRIETESSDHETFVTARDIVARAGQPQLVDHCKERVLSSGRTVLCELARLIRVRSCRATI